MPPRNRSSLRHPGSAPAARPPRSAIHAPLVGPSFLSGTSLTDIAIAPKATDDEVAAVLLALQILRREARYEVDSAWKRAMRKSILCHPELVEGSTSKQLLECSENF
jgi:hypothetical protein